MFFGRALWRGHKLPDRRGWIQGPFLFPILRSKLGVRADYRCRRYRLKARARFKKVAVQVTHGQIKFAGQWLSLWDSYGLDSYQIRAGNFCEDACGRWYLNACVAVPVAELVDRSRARRDVGIDLRLEELAATSDGEKLSAPQFYRGLEAKLAIAQRAGKKSRVRAIHAKIANRRKDSLHQFSTRLVRGYDTIFVGNVNASALAKTSHAKSVLDAGWSAFRTMLRYKCDFAGATFAEVNEAFSTQTRSACGVRSGPKGIVGLGIRVWTCGDCGTVHDRDVNAAKNILAADVVVLQKESPPFKGAGGRQLSHIQYHKPDRQQAEQRQEKRLEVVVQDSRSNSDAVHACLQPRRPTVSRALRHPVGKLIHDIDF